jgi:hypothetical protein
MNDAFTRMVAALIAHEVHLSPKPAKPNLDNR